MFESGVIITGGKRRSDINVTYASRDGAITPSRSVVAARESRTPVNSRNGLVPIQTKILDFHKLAGSQSGQKVAKSQN